MTDDLAAAVERVWPDRGARFELLGGGITNHNVKVELDGETYVLRVSGKDTELLGIDRGVELAATRAAASLGIGPDVLQFVEPEGWLVTRFLCGEVPPLERMREPETLERVAHALRLFHGGAPIPGRFDAFRIVEEYRDTALARGGAIPGDYGWAHEVAARIERQRAADTAVPMPQRPPERQLPRRRRAAVRRRLGVRGDGRSLLRPRELRDQPPARRGLPATAPRVLLRRGASRGRGRARAHGLHVRFPRGDVGRRTVRGLRARLRLRRLRLRALRAPAQGGVRVLRSRARRADDREAGARPHERSRSRGCATRDPLSRIPGRGRSATRRPRSEGRTRRASPLPCA